MRPRKPEIFIPFSSLNEAVRGGLRITPAGKLIKEGKRIGNLVPAASGFGIALLATDRRIQPEQIRIEPSIENGGHLKVEVRQALNECLGSIVPLAIRASGHEYHSVPAPRRARPVALIIRKIRQVLRGNRLDKGLRKGQ